MNRQQKAVVIDQIAADIKDSQAVFAVDFRGMTVAQGAEVRDKLRAVDASFRVVKNSLAERAADQADVAELKQLLAGPTALTFVRGDAATAAKAIADYARITQKLAFKGGVMDGLALSADQVSAISRLLSRQALYGQLVGLVASPLSGLVRTLNALVGGLAIQLGAILEKKQSGEIPAGDPPALAAAPVADAPPPEAAPTEEAAPAAEAAPTEEAAPAAETPPVPVLDAPTAAEQPPGDENAAAESAPSGEAQAEPAPADVAAAEPPQTSTPTENSGEEVAGAESAQAGEAQADTAPADAAPATDEPSHKENH